MTLSLACTGCVQSTGPAISNLHRILPGDTANWVNPAGWVEASVKSRVAGTDFLERECHSERSFVEVCSFN